jgi:hypothetical protein
MDFYKNLLGEIISVIMIYNHFTHMPVHTLLVGPHQQVKSIAAGFRIFYFLKKVFIVQACALYGLDLKDTTRFNVTS